MIVDEWRALLNRFYDIYRVSNDLIAKFDESESEIWNFPTRFLTPWYDFFKNNPTPRNTKGMSTHWNGRYWTKGLDGEELWRFLVKPFLHILLPKSK